HAIDQETDRLNRMVGNILDLSRLEADAWHPKLEWTPVSELIGMTLDQFSPDSNKRIDVNMSSSLTEINVDCVQMVQVIKNLVENALKYSKAEERIEINIFRDEDTAVIEVLDRGRGISDADLEHLFEPFYRAKDLQESSVPGVGVGLAVCRGLVEAHRGSLIAKNRDNGGAIFRVNLPMQPAGNP
ncbi:ATP-binding protein, partial [Candidatus Obscuribacterales bacterium]|nr:ATP-binding protein [Candidatus Obscuribacterales bacterium]